MLIKKRSKPRALCMCISNFDEDARTPSPLHASLMPSHAVIILSKVECPMMNLVCSRHMILGRICLNIESWCLAKMLY
jgi:hypothetical protein